MIFIPNVDVWYETLAGPALTAFICMLRTIQPTDSIMLVGTAETELENLSPDLKRDLFGLSNSNFVEVSRPAKVSLLFLLGRWRNTDEFCLGESPGVLQ